MNREVLSMNFDWRFHYGDEVMINFDALYREWFKAAEWLKCGNQGVSKAGYPDEEWLEVDLPHDFVIETGNFSPGHSEDHGSLPAGVGWYRKEFEISQDDLGKRLTVEYDGMFRNSKVWLNGHYVGSCLSGYASCQFDITDLCHYGENNALAVRVDATEHELWSYEGGGIYRNVRMVKTHPVHVDPWGTFVQAGLKEKEAKRAAVLSVSTTVCNQGESDATCTVASRIKDPRGEVVAEAQSTLSIEAGEKKETLQQITVDEPELWSPDSPCLYRLDTRLTVNDEEVDTHENPFGIRTIRFDPQEGFFLNGQSVKLKGVCCHQDHAGVGVALPDRLQEWRVERLKEMGCNAYRSAHNPASPAFLDACDRLGLMVMDENRILGASPEILSQLETMVRRGRNHPSIILWSLGNEEMNVQHTDLGIRLLRRMQDLVHGLDPTRPVTYAMNCDWVSIVDEHERQGFELDVFGANYTCERKDDVYAEFHRKHPNRCLVGTETGGSASTRGLYDEEQSEIPLVLSPHGKRIAVWTNPKRRGIVSAYGETFTTWGRSIMDTWKGCAEHPFMSGTFLWTGFDYHGETFPYGWPAVITRYGIMDLCGFPKDAYYYFRAWWRDEPLLHVFPHWNWRGREGESIDVCCYSNCVSVELSLNGKSHGRKSMERNGYLSWEVPYEPGKLLAEGFDSENKVILTRVVETTGAPAGIDLVPDRRAMKADRQDLIVVKVTVIDEKGRIVPTAENLVLFRLDGPARILGVGNGNPISHEADQADRRRVYNGLCQVIIQSTHEAGTITLQARSPGLESSEREQYISLESSYRKPAPLP